jgi:DNA-binding PadR family transcriptional regulator
LADKSTRLILDALARAAAEPAGLSLYAQKSEPGLFPSTAAAKVAADRARSDGLLQVVESEANGRKAREVGILTEKGRQYLARQASPRQVLEDFVRVLEDRRTEVAELSATVSRMAAGLEAIRNTVEQVIPRLTDHHTSNWTAMNAIFIPPRPPAPSASDALIADVKARLAEWHAASGASQDCPLPELYRKLESKSQVSVGLFHDALRQLHDDHQVYLHPWTGPLYALPEPAFALLVGHEVAYYASIR